MHVCQYLKLLSQKQINSLYKEHIAHLFNFVQPKNKFLVLLGNTNSAYGIVLHILHMVQKSHEQQKSVDIFIELL